MTATPLRLPKPTKIDPATEYVAGGQQPYGAFLQAARALPQPIELERELRPDLYSHMHRSDAHIRALTNIYRATIVGDGLETVSALDNENTDGYKMAGQFADECGAMMDDLGSSANDLLYQYTFAMIEGNVAGELVWEQRTSSTFYLGQSNVTTQKQRLVLKDIKIKPRHALAYVVDPYMNTIGLLALVPGQGNVTGNILVLTGEQQKNLLPREKFACYPWDPEYNDPRGTSVLRAVYGAWWEKVQIQGEYLKFLSQFASPMLIGELALDAPDKTLTDADGVPILDANGNQQVLTASQAMANSIMTLRNGAFMVHPNGAKVYTPNTLGTGQAFDIALHACNRDMALGILTQTLATGEGEHASRAQAGVHQDAFQTLTKQKKQGICGMVRSDIYRKYIDYNYGIKYRPLTPKASLGDVAETDFAALWAAASQLEGSGYLDISQKRPMDVQIGVPQRSAESVDLAMQVQQQALEAAKQPQQQDKTGQEQKQGVTNE